MLTLKTIVLVLVIFASCVSSGIILLTDDIPQFVKQPATSEIDDDVPFDPPEGPDIPELPGDPEVPEGGYDRAGGVRA